jgi:hypothetical protein
MAGKRAFRIAGCLNPFGVPSTSRSSLLPGPDFSNSDPLRGNLSRISAGAHEQLAAGPCVAGCVMVGQLNPELTAKRLEIVLS